MSSKNHPQLAYISNVARCSSSRRRAVRRVRSPPAFQRGVANVASARSRASGGSSTTPPYASRAAHGSRKRSPAASSKKAPATSRITFSASRSGPRQDWRPAPSPPMLQPQSRCQRPRPCAQLQAVPSPSSPSASCASQVGGCRARYEPRLVTSIPRRCASTRVANASVRSANFLWWPHSSPSDAHSTSRWPSALDRSADALTASITLSARLTVSPNATARDSGPSKIPSAIVRPDPSRCRHR
jgi:hypothetical protein